MHVNMHLTLLKYPRERLIHLYFTRMGSATVLCRLSTKCWLKMSCYLKLFSRLVLNQLKFPSPGLLGYLPRIVSSTETISMNKIQLLEPARLSHPIFQNESEHHCGICIKRHKNENLNIQQYICLNTSIIILKFIFIICYYYKYS